MPRRYVDRSPLAPSSECGAISPLRPHLVCHKPFEHAELHFYQGRDGELHWWDGTFKATAHGRTAAFVVQRRSGVRETVYVTYSPGQRVKLSGQLDFEDVPF